MPFYDPRVDEYIAKSADFAKPILNHLRGLVHQACPDVTETIKWSFPNFDYKGSILCSMASFKQHCAFNFWRASLLSDSNKILEVGNEKNAMGSLGQIKSLAELPADEVMIKYLKESMTLTDKGVKVPKKARVAGSAELEVPAYFKEALQQNEAARVTFEKFSPSNKKEYLDWITEAKTEATRSKRIASALEWLQEGKVRNWKYMKS